MKRVEAVRAKRMESKRTATLKLADTPTRFQTENMPKGEYIVIPEVSSQRRDFVPMGYMDDSVLCSNKLRLMPDASLYHFGVLMSNVHMAWMRAFCGRLKSDYDYSIKIVYNNFPWPNPTDDQRALIEYTAKRILEARAKYPTDSLADLYDPIAMTQAPDLVKAHRSNNVAVMKAYGLKVGETSADDCVEFLMKRYMQITNEG
jgi:hypothetical protein